MVSMFLAALKMAMNSVFARMMLDIQKVVEDRQVCQKSSTCLFYPPYCINKVINPCRCKGNILLRIYLISLKADSTYVLVMLGHSRISL